MESLCQVTSLKFLKINLEFLEFRERFSNLRSKSSSHRCRTCQDFETCCSICQLSSQALFVLQSCHPYRQGTLEQEHFPIFRDCLHACSLPRKAQQHRNHPYPQILLQEKKVSWLDFSVLRRCHREVALPGIGKWSSCAQSLLSRVHRQWY